MQAIVKILKASRTSASGFLADKRALAATEFAIILPLMLVLFFGTIEFSSAVAIDRKVTLIARTLSDLTSQSSGTMTDANMQNTFTASISIITPYDDTLVTGTISQIYIDTNSVAKIQWAKSATIASGATKAALTAPPSNRTAGSTVTTMIPSTLLIANSYLILSEVGYVYTPTVGYVLKSSLNLSDASYTRPRQATCIAYNNVPASC